MRRNANTGTEGLQTYVRFPVDGEQAFGQDVDVSRTYVRRRRTTLVLVTAIMASLVVGPVGNAFDAGAAVRHERRVVIRAGDTLWSIAGRLAPEADPRAVVDAIAEANEVDPVRLTPGARLVVPVP